jgi:glycosyltransferase involved in cell wall biosynthesis
MLAKKRILIVNDSLKAIGGAESYVLALSQVLKRSGLTIQLFGPESGVGLRDSFFSRWYSRKYYKQMVNTIQNFKPDIVHVHNFSRVLSPSVIKAASDANVPVIQTVHDYHYICPKLGMIDDKDNIVSKHDSDLYCLLHHQPKKKLAYAIPKHLKVKFHEKFIIKYVKLFICPSKDLQRFYNNKFNKIPSSYIPNFIPLDVSLEPIAKKHNNILFVGRLSQEKGVDILLRGLSEAITTLPKLTLTIIGSGPQENKLKKLSSELSIDKHVMFLGNIEHDKLASHYKEASVVIAPSLWLENCPMVMLESIGSARPVIASNVGGFNDLIQDNKTGFLFERGNYNDLATKIIELFLNPKTLDTFTINQKKLIKQYAAQQHVKLLLKIYKSVDSA